MRALVLTDWWQLEVQEVPDPQVGPDEVVLDIVATGICGSDIHGFTGENGRRRFGQVMGHETVGRIARIGAEVPGSAGLVIGGVATVNPVIACSRCTQCAAGRERACPDKRVIGVDPSYASAFAEQMLVPAGNVVPLPDSMPIEYGALVEPLAVGYHALRRGDCRPGDSVLVIGGGPIGQACVLAARRLSAQAVVVSEPDSHRRQLTESIGARSVDPTSTDDLPGRVEELLGGPPTLVVDAVGMSRTVTTALNCAPFGATVVLVGMGAQSLELPAFGVSTQERSLVGSFCYSAGEFQQTADWVGTAPPELAALIEGRVGLHDSNAAFTALAKGESAASKILVFPAGTDSAENRYPAKDSG